jgi:hypothetical protein
MRTAAAGMSGARPTLRQSGWMQERSVTSSAQQAIGGADLTRNNCVSIFIAVAFGGCGFERILAD